MLVYERLSTEGMLPNVDHLSPYKSVVVSEKSVTPDSRASISSWLVDSGCLYMMAWGNDCNQWDDSVDLANIEKFNHEEIPDDQFVMTTWHDDETIQEVFWYAKNLAFHDSVELENVLILHIGHTDRSKEYKDMYGKA